MVHMDGNTCISKGVTDYILAYLIFSNDFFRLSVWTVLIILFGSKFLLANLPHIYMPVLKTIKSLDEVFLFYDLLFTNIFHPI